MADKTLSVELDEVLEEYNDELDENVQIVMLAVAKETAKKLQDTSPKKTGRYARGWTVQSDFDSKTYTVYNAAKPSLTHLLENGHLRRNQFGTYGRVDGIPHIKPAEEWANAEVLKRLESRLNNG